MPPHTTEFGTRSNKQQEERNKNLFKDSTARLIWWTQEALFTENLLRLAVFYQIEEQMATKISGNYKKAKLRM